MKLKPCLICEEETSTSLCSMCEDNVFKDIKENMNNLYETLGNITENELTILRKLFKTI